MLSLNLRDIPILNINGSDYCRIISLISKNEAIIYLKMQLKVVVSNKVSFGKYFIGYKDDKKIRPLCLFPPK